MASIFEIQNDLAELFAQIEDNGGELTEELSDKLTITQEEFKDKVQSYVNAIKSLECDLAAIKDEKDRLDTLKKSKEKTIDRLKEILANAINNYGDRNKSENPFVDFGTGKVSICQTESIEVNEAVANCFTNRVLNFFSWLKFTNTFQIEDMSAEKIRNYANLSKSSEEGEEPIELHITEEDLDYLGANLNLKLNLRDLISTEGGRNLMQTIINYTSAIVMKPDINKVSVKRYIKENGVEPEFASLVIKNSVRIK